MTTKYWKSSCYTFF